MFTETSFIVRRSFHLRPDQRTNRQYSGLLGPAGLHHNRRVASGNAESFWRLPPFVEDHGVLYMESPGDGTGPGRRVVGSSPT
jgi:hypothetical protein